MADETRPPIPPGGETQAQPQQGQAAPQFPTDYSHLSTVYTNFCRVSVTPEELVLDFGLNTQQVTAAGTPEAVRLNQRLVMSFYTAKRLLSALQWAVNRYEGNFGVLETDFQKRLRPQQQRSGPGVFGNP